MTRNMDSKILGTMGLTIKREKNGKNYKKNP